MGAQTRNLRTIAMLYIFNKNDGVQIAWNGLIENNTRTRSMSRGLFSSAIALIRTSSAG